MRKATHGEARGIVERRRKLAAVLVDDGNAQIRADEGRNKLFAAIAKHEHGVGTARGKPFGQRALELGKEARMVGMRVPAKFGVERDGVGIGTRDLIDAPTVDLRKMLARDIERKRKHGMMSHGVEHGPHQPEIRARPGDIRNHTPSGHTRQTPHPETSSGVRT